MKIQKYGNINIWPYGNMEYRNWEIWKFGNREIGKIGNRELGKYRNMENMEKFYILFRPEGATLNKRSELFSTCRHRLSQLLENT